MDLPESKPVSQRRFAGLLGVAHVTVQAAVKSGRLRRSVNAAGKIIDVALAKREWLQNTDRTEASHAVIERADRIAAELEGSEVPPALTMSEASLAEKHWKSKIAELKYLESAGELVPAKDVKQKLTDILMACRSKLLGIPSRARQADPELTTPQVALIESLIREALEDLSEGKVT